jgi:hypothetical protein
MDGIDCMQARCSGYVAWGMKILGCAMREEYSEYSLLCYSFQKDILNIRSLSLSLADNLNDRMGALNIPRLSRSFSNNASSSCFFMEEEERCEEKKMPTSCFSSREY